MSSDGLFHKWKLKRQNIVQWLEDMFYEGGSQPWKTKADVIFTRGMKITRIVSGKRSKKLFEINEIELTIWLDKYK